MATTKAFTTAYRKLNANQRAAVDALDGPVMVIAGPGTGKTQVLMLRIANILVRTDADPQSILALTFTEKAASEMRTRLVELIGQAAYGVRIGTFHAFCNEVIGTNPDSFPELAGCTPLTDAEQLELVEHLLDAPDVRLLRPPGKPDLYVRAAIGRIGDIKGKGRTAEAFAALVDAERPAEDATERERRAHGRTAELAALYARYERSLRRQHRYDFADMLLAVDRALERDGDLRLDLAERFQYVLVDEHQDTNRVQNSIVRRIVESGEGDPNVFVVGDMAQAIYRFQGASPENFRDFSERYRSCRTIRLDESYRSGQAILDASLHVSPEGTKLSTATRRPSEPAQLYAFSTLPAMAHGVAQLVARHLRGGVPPGQVAVLYRTNREADALADALEAAGIACAVVSDQTVLGDRDIRKLLTVLRAAVHVGQAGPLMEALQVDLLGVSPVDAARIGRHAHERGADPWRTIRSPRTLTSLGVGDTDAVIRTADLLRDVARLVRNEPPAVALQELVARTGWIARAVRHERGEVALAKLSALYDAVYGYAAAERLPTAAGFLASLDRMERHGTDVAALTRVQADAVQLMTVHRAKGLEFDAVIVTNAVRGHWDDARRPARLPLPAALTAAGDDDPDVDAQRLFYVAITRARRHLAIIWPERTVEGSHLEPSRFVTAIPAPLAVRCDAAPLEATYVDRVRATPRPRRAPLQQRSFVEQLVREQPLSVTALNNFLACPWRYYFLNLVRIREAPLPKGVYGSAAHAALSGYFTHLRRGGRAGKQRLLRAFRAALAGAPLPGHVVRQLEHEGTAALGGWHDRWRGSWVTDVETERTVRGVELAPGVPITGTLDKVERLPDGTVNVVDYKTKAPMSRNAITGATRSSTGNEHRQLLFYRLLLDAQGSARHRMQTGEIDFLAPAPNGSYRKERFTVTQEQADELRECILAAVARIAALGFWNERCTDRTCRYCALREQVAP